MEGSPKNSVLMLAAFAVATVLNLAFSVSMGWMLSLSDYGVLGLFTAVAFILSMFMSSGFPPTIAKLLSERQYIANIRKSRERLLLAIVGNLVLGAVLSVGAYAGYYVYYRGDAYYHELIYVLVILVMVAAVGWVLRGALQGLFRFRELSGVQMLDPALKLSIALTLVWLGLGVRGAIYAMLLASVMSTAVCLFLLRDMVFPLALKLNVSRFSLSWLRRVVSTDLFVYSPPIFVGLFGLTLLVNIDIVSLKLLGGASMNREIGLYQADIVIGKLPFFLASVVLNVVFPYISHHTVDAPVMGHYARRTMKYLFVFLVPLGLIIALLPAHVLTLVFPPDFIEGADALRVYAVASMLLVVGTGFMRILQAAGRPTLPALAMLVALTADVLLLLALVPRFSIVGAALSTMGASLCFMLMGVVMFARAVPLSLGRTTLWYVGALFVLGLTLMIVPHGSRWTVLFDITASYILYLLVLVRLGVLDRLDIEAVGSAVGRRGRMLALSLFYRVRGPHR